MSLSVTTDVFCDGPDCTHWVDGTEGRDRAEAAEARLRACLGSRYGVFRRDGKAIDLCWDCQTPAERARTITRQAVAAAAEQAAMDARGEQSVPVSQIKDWVEL